MRILYPLIIFLILHGYSLSAQHIQAIKIGESSNAYSNLLPQPPSIVSLPGMGDGVIATVYRHNVFQCAGGGNRTCRFSISTDAGKSWDIGADTVPPVFSGCYGKGPVHTLNPQFGPRYPSLGLFARGSSNQPNSLAMVFAAPNHGESYNGFLHSLIFDPASPQYHIQQEGFFTGNLQEEIEFSDELSYQKGPQGEHVFWRTAFAHPQTWLDKSKDFFIIKGVYSPHRKAINWKIQQKVLLSSKMNPTGIITRSCVTAFDPSGRYGWIAILGDLAGGQDTTFNPILMSSQNYGQTWSEPEEINLGDFQVLKDRILSSTSGGSPTGKASCTKDAALTVDVNGNPHLLVGIAAASTLAQNQAAYFTIHPESYLGLYDITKSECEEAWGLLHVDDLNAFVATFGDTAVGSSRITVNTFLQISRSEDGTKICYSWTDTDTTGQLSPLNTAPDLKGRALDVNSELMTPIVNWTQNDSLWQGKALTPQTAALVLQDLDTFTLPTVVMMMDPQNPLAPVSYWYFPDISYAKADFMIPADYVFGCRPGNILVGAQRVEPTCNQANGSLDLAVTGGTPPYQYQWGANANFADSSAVINLAAKVYQVRITDSLGCQKEADIILNNPNVPPVSIDSQSVQPPICHGDSNGKILALSPLSSLSFLWSNGETVPQATRLPAGKHELKVTDGNGCEYFWLYEMEEPDSIEIQLIIQPSICAFDESGTAEALVTGGLGGPFTYKWSNGWQGEKVVGLNGGPLEYTIIDQGGCEVHDTVMIPGSTEPLRYDRIQVRHATSCQFNNLDGQISVLPAGGTPPYNNFFSGGFRSTLMGRLGPGLYTFEVIDSLGCHFQEQAYVKGPEPHFPIVQINTSDPICAQGPFTFEALIQGGNPPFSYTWVRENAVGNGTVVGTGPTLSNVPGARFVCLIEQDQGCDLIARFGGPTWRKPVLDFGFTSPHINPNGPKGALNASVREVKNPYDYRYAWANGVQGPLQTGLAAGLYSGTTTDSVQCLASGTVELKDKSSSLFIQAELIHDCKGQGTGEIRLHLPPNISSIQLQWAHGPRTPTIRGLSPGSYTLLVTDSAKSCPDSYTYVIREATPLQLDAVVRPIACKGGNDGRIDLTVCGGNGYPIIYWNTGDSSQHLQNLPLGSYQVHVIDEMGCFQDSLSVVMTEVPDSLQVTASTSAILLPAYEGKAFATASGGWPPYTYVWNARPTQRRDTARYLTPGMYQVVATDRRGCTAADSVRVDTKAGIVEVFPAKVSVYPNPNRGNFWLEVEGDYPQSIELQVLDIQGKILINQSLGRQKDLRHQIQLGEVSVGMYFLQVKVGKYVWREKMLVER